MSVRDVFLCGGDRMKWTRYLSFLLPILLNGCSSKVEPPDNPPALREDLIDSVSFTIEGVDPREQELTLISKTSYPFAAEYIRPTNRGHENWSGIVFLLMSNDDSEKPAGIQQERHLGYRSEEQQLSDDRVGWKCEIFKNRPPNFRPPVASGRYEIRLCWYREPTTVDEKITRQKDPESFQIPFYRAYINVRNEE